MKQTIKENTSLNTRNEIDSYWQPPGVLVTNMWNFNPSLDK